MQFPTTKQEGICWWELVEKVYLLSKRATKKQKALFLFLCKDVMVGALAVRDKPEHGAKEPGGDSQKRPGIRIFSKITELQKEPPTFPSSRPLVNEQGMIPYYAI